VTGNTARGLPRSEETVEAGIATRAFKSCPAPNLQVETIEDFFARWLLTQAIPGLYWVASSTLNAAAFVGSKA